MFCHVEKYYIWMYFFQGDGPSARETFIFIKAYYQCYESYECCYDTYCSNSAKCKYKHLILHQVELTFLQSFLEKISTSENLFFVVLATTCIVMSVASSYIQLHYSMLPVINPRLCCVVEDLKILEEMFPC